MLLKLLNTRVEATDTSEHLVMLLLEALYFFAGVNDLLLELSDSDHCFFIRLLSLIEMLFHVSTSCYCLNGQPLLPLKFVFEVISLTHQLVVLLHGHGHLINGLILLYFALFSENGFGPEHGREQFCILSDLFKLLIDVFLELPGVSQLWNVKVFIFVIFIFSLSQLSLQ